VSQTGGLPVECKKFSLQKWVIWGLQMRANNAFELIYLGSDQPKAEANVYDIGARQTESSCGRRIKALEHENALLMLMISELGTDIMRVRGLLAER
jgi:hypothetical protein